MLFLMFGCAGALRMLALECDQPMSAWGIHRVFELTKSPIHATAFSYHAKGGHAQVGDAGVDDTGLCHLLGRKTERPWR
jgi:hypothetical protein